MRMGGSNSKDAELLKRIQKKAAERRQQMQILLIGAGESGKSTILKQIMLIHGEGFSHTMRLQYVHKISVNLVYGAIEVYDGAVKLDIKVVDPTVQAASARLRAVRAGWMEGGHGEQAASLNRQMIADIIAIYDDDACQKALAQSWRFQLEDTWEALVSKLKALGDRGYGDPAQGWLPDDESILLSRARTAGVVQVKFKIDDVPFTVVDVGGQRAERKKWIALFANISGLIFVSALSEYNQKLYEDQTVNRLTESLQLFKQTCARPEFENSAIMLFLNKFDLFQQKYFYNKIRIEPPLDDIDVEDIPKAEDEKNPICEKATTWFIDIFLKQLEGGPRKVSEVYPHITTALDRSNVSKVFDSCATFVLKRNLLDVGLV